MENETRALQGSRIPLVVEQGDVNSISATLIAKGQETGTTIEVTGLFSDGLADVSIPSSESTVVDTYDLQVNENFQDEDPLKYPGTDCDGDCEFPTLVICESLDEETS